MPLVTGAVLAYIVGLAAGFAGAATPGVLVGAAVLAVFALRMAPRQGGLVMVTVAGGAAAADARAADAACARRVVAVGVALVRLDTALLPRRTATGRVLAAGCGVRVWVRAAEGRVPAGSVVQLRGTFARREGALDIVRPSIAVRRGPGLLARWRATAGARVDRLYATDGPLARALLLADARDVAPDVRERFSDAGIIHMLSVSGLHVAIVAGAVREGALAAGLGAALARWGSLAVVVAFVGFIGAPPPALRSAALLAVLAVAQGRQRPSAPWAAWAVSCAVPLVDPRVVLDLGWQLSVAGMAGLLASGRVVQRVPPRWPRLVRAAASSALATAVASLATAPLVAWTFGRVSVAALATNALAGPLFDVAQPLLFLSLLVPLDGPARLVAGAARAVLALIDAVARVGAAMPMAVIGTNADAVTVVALGAAATATCGALAARHPRRLGVVALLALGGAAWWPVVRRPPGLLELHVVDVGQGDALALRTPRGRWVLVDAGPAWRGGDAGQRVVRPYVRRVGGRVAVLALSHPHLDHVGGAASLVRTLGVDRVWDSGYAGATPEYRALLDTLRARRVPWERLRVGAARTIDGVHFDALAPDTATVAGEDDPNEASLVLRVGYGAARFLLMGDAGARAEAGLLARAGAGLRADVLKVGHHGSRTSSTPAFLAAVRPRVAVVSVGAGNRYGHPGAEVLQRLAASGVQVLRTDDAGSIVVRTDGVRLWVRAGGDRWTYRAGAGAACVDRPRRDVGEPGAENDCRDR